MSVGLVRVPFVTSATAAPVGVLRRKCDCEGSDHECEDCKKKSPLQRRSSGGMAPARAPGLVHEVLGTPGRQLDPSSRALMEARFGHNFGGVRVHADARAAESARQVRATAYTV